MIFWSAMILAASIGFAAYGRHQCNEAIKVQKKAIESMREASIFYDQATQRYADAMAVNVATIKAMAPEAPTDVVH